jgi:glucosamine kinase
MVIGIDGGGTTTRALAVDMTGAALAYVETGGTNPQHNVDAQAQMHAAIRQVLTAASHQFADVMHLTAGIAGLNEPPDLSWAEQHTAVPGLTCPRVHLNDAEVAHAGAFGVGPGIIAIAGTGSIIFAVTHTGRRLTNDAFYHYAAAARHLAFTTMHHLLLGEAGLDDEGFLAQVLHYWQVPDLATLRELVINQADEDNQHIKRAYGGMATIITAAAATSPLARRMCDEVVRVLTEGVRLLGHCFAQLDVSVALVGSLARSQAICDTLAAVLARAPERCYHVVEPSLPPVAGAALLSLSHAGIPVDDTLRARLRDTLEVVPRR